MRSVADTLQAQFAAFGPVQARGMFGGHGVFFEGLMIALQFDQQLYLKVDAVSRTLFEQAGSRQFIYERMARPVGLSYFTAPPAFYRNADGAHYWSAQAYDAARRASARKAGRKKTKARPAPRWR